MDARTLNCPGCGAPASSDAPTCRYCNARLASVACPKCFGLVFVGSRNCSHCGAVLARREAEGARLRCPGCRQEMEAVEVGATRLHECSGCLGLWLDTPTFEQVSREAEAQAAVLPRLQRAPSGAAAAPASVRYVPCPVCATMMNRINFARLSGVVVDVCSKDGVWLECGELQRIVEFVRAGGLERSRERERMRLEEERRRLDAARLAQGSPAGPYAGDDAGTGLELRIDGTLLGSLLRWRGWG